MRTEQSACAWIFLSIDENPSELYEVIGNADAINKDIPTQIELQNSLGWLLTHGFISKENNAYRYTEKGARLIKESETENASIFQTWHVIEKKFTELNSSPVNPENISTEDYEKSYQQYSKHFDELYKSLDKQ